MIAHRYQCSTSGFCPYVKDTDQVLANYLDTRGFVLFRLGQQAQAKDPQRAKARYQAALTDMDEAIRLLNRWKKAVLEQLKNQGSARQAYAERSYNEGLGVMHQHRYQVYEALGEREKAGVDREFAGRLGYDPAKHGL